jgi:hypothetical protein
MRRLIANSDELLDWCARGDLCELYAYALRRSPSSTILSARNTIHSDEEITVVLGRNGLDEAGEP